MHSPDLPAVQPWANYSLSASTHPNTAYSHLRASWLSYHLPPGPSGPAPFCSLQPGHTSSPPSDTGPEQSERWCQSFPADAVKPLLHPCESHFCATLGLPAGSPVSQNASPTKESLTKYFRAGANSHSPSLGTSPRSIGPCQIVPIANALRGLACSSYTGAAGCRGSFSPGAAQPPLPVPSRALPDVPHRAASVPAFCQTRSPLRPGSQPPPGASTAPPSALPSAGLPCSGTGSPGPVLSRPGGSCQRRGRQRARSGRGSAVLRRLGRVPPSPPAPPAPLSPRRRQNKAPGPGPGPGPVPPRDATTVRDNGRGAS